MLFSACIIVLGLVPPLAFQYVINDVLPNRAFETLIVIAAALALTYTFDPFLTWLRQYTTAHVGAQLDLILGSRLYEHLLGLTLNRAKSGSPSPVCAKTSRSGISDRPDADLAARSRLRRRCEGAPRKRQRVHDIGS